MLPASLRTCFMQDKSAPKGSMLGFPVCFFIASAVAVAFSSDLGPGPLPPP